jgi:hypothetical protein
MHFDVRLSYGGEFESRQHKLAGITNGTLSSSWIDQARSGSTCAGHTTSKRDAYETTITTATLDHVNPTSLHTASVMAPVLRSPRSPPA